MPFMVRQTPKLSPAKNHLYNLFQHLSLQNPLDLPTSFEQPLHHSNSIPSIQSLPIAQPSSQLHHIRTLPIVDPSPSITIPVGRQVDRYLLISTGGVYRFTKIIIKKDNAKIQFNPLFHFSTFPLFRLPAISVDDSSATTNNSNPSHRRKVSPSLHQRVPRCTTEPPSKHEHQQQLSLIHI